MICFSLMLEVMGRVPNNQLLHCHSLELIMANKTIQFNIKYVKRCIIYSILHLMLFSDWVRVNNGPGDWVKWMTS